jgi:hypothetical protein
MGGQRNQRSSSNHSAFHENFGTSLLESLRDPAIVEALKVIMKGDADLIADLVTARLDVRFQKMEAKIIAKDRRIEEHQKSVNELSHKYDDVEQYSRRTSVRITRVPEVADEDVEQKTAEVFECLEITPTINRVHRVGAPRKPSEPPRPILCQFLQYKDKINVLKTRKELREDGRGLHQRRSH